MTQREPQNDDFMTMDPSRRRLHLREVQGSAAGRYDGIGSELRAARMRNRLDLDAVSVKLRINAAYLLAIEEGRFADLPGDVYVYGFLRTYAQHLGIDAEAVIQQYKTEAANPKPTAKLDFPSPMDRGRLPTLRILLVSVALAALIYGGWSYLTEDDRQTAERVAPLPERFANLVAPAAPPASAPSSAPTPAVPAPVPMALSPAADASPPAAATAPAADPPPTPAPVTAASPAPPAAAAATPAAPASLLAGDDPRRRVGEASPPPVVASVPPAALPGQEGVARRFGTVTERPGASAVVPTPPAAPPAPAPVVAPLAAAPALADEPAAAEEEDSEAPPPPTPRAADAARAGEITIATLPPAAPPVPAVPAPSTQAFGATSEPSRITVHADIYSWVQVTTTSGQPVFARMLRAGDRYLVPNRPGLRLMTGNGGGLRITVDGSPTPPIGTLGSVVRDVVLDPERLLRGNAAVNENPGG